MIVVDIIIAVLLALTIWYCFKLNAKIVELQKSKKDLAILFKYFDNAIKRAEEALDLLKQSTAKTSTTIDSKINESKVMVDEMAFFLEKSSKTLKNLEEIQAKISLKEHIIQQDNYRQTNNIYTQPVHDEYQARRPIVTSPQTILYSSKPKEEESAQESKKLAIESLLEKIAEIQRKTRGNAT